METGSEKNAVKKILNLKKIYLRLQSWEIIHFLMMRPGGLNLRN